MRQLDRRAARGSRNVRHKVKYNASTSGVFHAHQKGCSEKLSLFARINNYPERRPQYHRRRQRMRQIDLPSSLSDLVGHKLFVKDRRRSPM